jgi:hypothetical protein
MTAISWMYIQSGFAFAADGRSRWDDEATVTEAIRQQESDFEQKIFTAEYQGQGIVYAITGAVYSEDKTFNLITESDKAAKAVAAEQFDQFGGYIDAFALQVKNAIGQARKDGRIPRYDPAPFMNDHPIEKLTIARIFVAAYFRNQPGLAVVRFFHNFQVVSDPEIHIETPPKNGFHIGSSVIFQELFRDKKDIRFDKYRKDVPFDGPLGNVAEAAHLIVEAQCDPIAAELDPLCKGIGGHIHVGTLTPNGFKWRIPPKKF